MAEVKLDIYHIYYLIQFKLKFYQELKNLLKNEEFFFGLLIISSTLLTFCLILLFFFKRMKNKTNNELNDENQELLNQVQRKRFGLIHLQMNPSLSMARKTEYFY